MKDVSIVIPVHNEEENLKILCEKIHDTISGLKKTYNIVFVEDGSCDKSFEILLELKKTYNNLSLIKLKRRYGQSVAIAIGIHFSEGKTVITMDSDLQNDPQDIPILINKVSENCAIVCGWRKLRQDPYVTKVLLSKLGNKILSSLSGIEMHDFSCTFKAFNGNVAKIVGRKLCPGFHRFIPLIGKKLDFSICEIEVTHQKRLYGKSKYTPFRAFKALVDLIIILLRNGSYKDIPEENLLEYVEKTIL